MVGGKNRIPNDDNRRDFTRFAIRCALLQHRQPHDPGLQRHHTGFTASSRTGEFGGNGRGPLHGRIGLRGWLPFTHGKPRRGHDSGMIQLMNCIEFQLYKPKYPSPASLQVESRRAA